MKQRDEFKLEYPCHSPEKDRWFVLRVTRFENSQGLRVVIQPSIDEVSFETPWDSETDFYDVTIHYSLTFYAPTGELMTRWSFFGHGRARSAFFSQDEPVEKAVLAAMRDAAALLVVELGERPEVKGTLQANQEDFDGRAEDHDS